MSCATRSLGFGTSSLALGGALLFGAGLFTPTPISAHAFAPSLLELEETAEGDVRVLWRTSLLRPAGTSLEPRLPGACEATTPPTATQDGRAALVQWRVGCAASELAGAEIGVDGLAESRTAALVRVRFLDGSEYSSLLQRGQQSAVVVVDHDPLEVARDYGVLGVGHILSGVDHLLFVLGLVLLIEGRRRLLYTITAFTLGHSVTLALATLGWIELPSAPVEVAIAASLVAVAYELVGQARGGRMGLLVRRPWLASGGFGLLHGLGFAGALREAGLPRGEIPLALVSFNVGIEVGQLLFIGGLLAAHGLATRFASASAASWTPHWGRVGAAYVIGSLAAYWCVARTALMFR